MTDINWLASKSIVTGLLNRFKTEMDGYLFPELQVTHFLCLRKPYQDYFCLKVFFIKSSKVKYLYPLE
jgi:hypothetical protein